MRADDGGILGFVEVDALQATKDLPPSRIELTKPEDHIRLRAMGVVWE